MIMKIDVAAKRVRKFFLKHKRVPTYEEMAELFGFSSKNASYYMATKLIEAGLLGKERNGRLYLKNLFAIPHLGNIKAGYPMPAFPAHDDSINVYDYLHDTTGDIYFLTVSGDSMIEAQIAEGDKIIVDPSKTPVNGDIVAAVVDNEWTVKYFYKVNGQIELRPANKNYPILRPTESLEIEGIVTAIIRKYR